MVEVLVSPKARERDRDLRVERERVVPELASIKAGVEPEIELMCAGGDEEKRWVNMEEDGVGTEGNGDLYIVGSILDYSQGSY
jgi:hypothetical protein